MRGNPILHQLPPFTLRETLQGSKEHPVWVYRLFIGERELSVIGMVPKEHPKRLSVCCHTETQESDLPTWGSLVYIARAMLQAHGGCE